MGAGEHVGAQPLVPPIPPVSPYFQMAMVHLLDPFPASSHHWVDKTSLELQFCYVKCELDFSKSNPTWAVLGRFLLKKTLNWIVL